jgi:deoxyuridine 5'-triphosphate nucleotidohydrolase
MADIPAWDESIGFVLALKVKKLSPDAILPVRGTSRAAGYDLFATKSVIIAPHEKAPVPTDLAVQIPSGYYGRIAPRSGLAVKHFIDVGAGVIDEDYRGPVIVLLFNFSSDAFQVNKGDRIAQLLLEKIATPVVVEVGELDQTERGDGGFGSTGMNAPVRDQMEIEVETRSSGKHTQAVLNNIITKGVAGRNVGERDDDVYHFDVDLLRLISNNCFSKMYSDLTSTLTPILEIVFARESPLAVRIKAIFEPYWKDNKFATEIAGVELEKVRQAIIGLEVTKEALKDVKLRSSLAPSAPTSAASAQPFQLIPQSCVQGSELKWEFPKGIEIKWRVPNVLKRYLQPNEIQELSLELALKIYNSGFRPDFLVALWRGGAIPGCYVQGYLSYLGVKCDHVAIRTSSYDNKQTQTKEILIHSLGHLKKQVCSHHTILIVDDVHDSGHTIRAFVAKLMAELRANYPKNPAQVKIATLFYKPSRNQYLNKPDYCVEETDQWLVFPHELEDMTKEEISEYYPVVTQFLPK